MSLGQAAAGRSLSIELIIVVPATIWAVAQWCVVERHHSRFNRQLHEFLADVEASSRQEE